MGQESITHSRKLLRDEKRNILNCALYMKAVTSLGLTVHVWFINFIVNTQKRHPPCHSSQAKISNKKQSRNYYFVTDAGYYIRARGIVVDNLIIHTNGFLCVPTKTTYIFTFRCLNKIKRELFYFDKYKSVKRKITFRNPRRNDFRQKHRSNHLFRETN